MEAKVHKWQTGAFIFVGLMLFIVTLFLLGGDKAFKKYSNYWIEFDQVQGLNPGSVVSLGGINVGNVEQILFNQQSNKIQVEVRVDKRMAHQITSGVKADLRTQGALGDKYIYLVPGSIDQQPIAENQFIPSVVNKDILSVLSERGGEAEKIFDIIGNVKDLTGKFNDQKRIEQIMDNMTVASENFRVASANLNKMTSNPNFIKSFDRLDAILMKVERGQGTLGALINDSSLHDQLKAMLGASKNKDSMRNVLRNSIKEEVK